MKYDANTVKEYIAAIPEERRGAIKHLISIIKKNAPKTKESMTYNMPSYGFEKPIFSIASQKNHMALYVCDHEELVNYKSSLGKVNIGKSCIRFKKLENLYIDVVEQLIKEVYNSELKKL